MDRHIAVSAMAQAWLDRTHSGLHNETIIAVYVLSIIAILIGCRALFTLRRSVKDMEVNPSDRSQIYAECHKRVLTCTRRQFVINSIYLLHAMGLWLIDAGIGIWAIWSDVDSNPEQWSPDMWLDLAINGVSTLAVFMAVFFIFPMAQILLVGYIVKRRGATRATLADYAPEGRIMTTHIAQLWLMFGFMIIAWWPVLDHTFYRLLAAEAAFGSGIAWQHLSFAFNFRFENMDRLEVQPLLGVRDGVKFYGQQIMVTHSKEGLPVYQELPQNNNEKA